MSEQNALNKILWHCRRGTKELDKILNDFVESSYGSLSDEEINLFTLLLQNEDPILNQWLFLNDEPKDQGMIEIVEKILSTR